MTHLHEHVHARYAWESDDYKGVPVWRKDPRFALGPRHKPLCEALARELHAAAEQAHHTL